VREDWVAEKAIDLAMVIRCGGSISELAQAICKPIFRKIGEITGLEERDAKMAVADLASPCKLRTACRLRSCDPDISGAMKGRHRVISITLLSIFVCTAFSLGRPAT
jgi:hypothetical protein